MDEFGRLGFAENCNTWEPECNIYVGLDDLLKESGLSTSDQRTETPYPQALNTVGYQGYVLLSMLHLCLSYTAVFITSAINGGWTQLPFEEPHWLIVAVANGLIFCSVTVLTHFMSRRIYKLISPHMLKKLCVAINRVNTSLLLCGAPSCYSYHHPAAEYSFSVLPSLGIGTQWT